MTFKVWSFHGPRMEIEADTPAAARAAYLAAHPAPDGLEPDVNVVHEGALT